jgi:hypothetical protein
MCSKQEMENKDKGRPSLHSISYQASQQIWDPLGCGLSRTCAASTRHKDINITAIYARDIKLSTSLGRATLIRVEDADPVAWVVDNKCYLPCWATRSSPLLAVKGCPDATRFRCRQG